MKENIIQTTGSTMRKTIILTSIAMTFFCSSYATHYAGDKQEASNSQIQVINNSDANQKNYYEIGLKQLELHNYTEAIESFNLALEKDPRNAEIWDRRGTAYFDLNNYSQAISDYTVAINLAEMPIQLGFYYSERSLAYYAVGLGDASMIDLIMAARLGEPHAQLLLIHYGIPWRK